MWLVVCQFARRRLKAWGKRQREEDAIGMITADVLITLARLVGTKLWTMEKERHVMLEIGIDPDNVSVLAVRSYVAIWSYLHKHYLLSNSINHKFKSHLNSMYFHQRWLNGYNSNLQRS